MKRAVFIVLALFVLVQFIRPSYEKIEQSDQPLEIVAPKEVMDIFQKACYNCHSNSVELPWYSSITPISLMIAKNVNNGRSYLNFSQWNGYSQEKKEESLKAIYRTIYASMPPQMYVAMHKNANLTKEERKLVRDWIGYSK